MFYFNALNAKSITSGNSFVWLTAGDIYPVPIKIEKIAESGLNVQQHDISTSISGIDGKMCHGIQPSPIFLEIPLHADSQSIQALDLIIHIQRSLGYVIPISLLISSSSLSETWLFSTGTITSSSEMPPLAKSWGDRVFTFTFQNASPAPAGFNF